MPKNKHGSRDSKVQPSEVNEMERPLVSYSNQPLQAKTRGEPTSYPRQGGHSIPLDPTQNRPAALQLNSTNQVARQPQTHPHGQHAGMNVQQSKTQPKRHQVQYCAKHAPLYANSSSSLTHSKPSSGKKSPSTPQSPAHSHIPPKATAGDHSKACQLHNVSSPERLNSGAKKTSQKQQQQQEQQQLNQKDAKRKGESWKLDSVKTKQISKVDKTKNVDKQTSKNQVPEVTSIPQTNMSIGLLVFCCFNPFLGALAIYLSLTAAKAYRDGNDSRGASRAHWSILMSLFGIMITMVVVSSLVVFFAVNKHSNQKYRSSISLPQGF